MLTDFEIIREEVSYRGASVQVRGLALFDITALVPQHLDQMNKLFDLYKSSDELVQNVAAAESVKFALKLVHDAPDLVASMIVRACDEDETPGVKEHVMRLPIGFQIELARKIIDLTFAEAGGAKKLFDNLMMMATQIRPSIE